MPPEAGGARAMFEQARLRDGRIVEYREVADSAPAFVDTNFASGRTARIAAKQGAEPKGRPEMRRHLQR